MIALLAFGVARQEVDASGLLLPADPNLGGLATIIAALALLMAVLWIGALVRLARQRNWGWFVALLILQLVGLGIIGMGVYAIAGPMDVDLSRREVT